MTFWHDHGMEGGICPGLRLGKSRSVDADAVWSAEAVPDRGALPLALAVSLPPCPYTFAPHLAVGIIRRIRFGQSCVPNGDGFDLNLSKMRFKKCAAVH